MRSWLTTLVLLLASAAGASGQNEILEDVCACSASTYEFTFDFSLYCPPVNITTGDAIAATSCLITPFGDPEVTDLIPVSVQSIDILELGQDLSVLVQENIEGNFVDGDSFNYTSVAANPDAIGDYLDIPRAIQINAVAVNALDEPIINVYIITFTNDCNAYPVLFEGQYAGWTRFVSKFLIESKAKEAMILHTDFSFILTQQTDLGPPKREVCPFGVGPPDTPTAPPSVSVPPTERPATAPPPVSVPPTEAPTERPSMSMSMSMSYDSEDMAAFADINVEFGGRKKAKKGGSEKVSTRHM